MIGSNHEPKQGAKGHHWETYVSDGNIIYHDLGGYHGGPICKNCGYSYCQHCDDEPDEECPNPVLEGECVRVDNQKALEHAQD